MSSLFKFYFCFTTIKKIVTTEYRYHNPLREDIGKIVTNTIREHSKINGHNPYYKQRESGNFQFLNKLENKTKNTWVQRQCILYQVKRREIASKGRFEMLKINDLIFTTEGSIEQHIINIFVKMNMPVMWRKVFFEYCFKERFYLYLL